MRRVVITGMGAVTPVGNGVQEYWSGLKSGKSGIATIDFFDTTRFKTKVAAKCNIDISQHYDQREARRLSRYMQLGLIAAKEAVAQSGIMDAPYPKESIGVIVGSGVGGITSFEQEILKGDPVKMSPFAVTMMVTNMLPGQIAIDYGFKGHCCSVSTACSTGNNAIGDGYNMIKYGMLDAMVVGGSEAALAPAELSAFANMMALTKCEDPARASIPFDKERGGFVMGEGAGILILEEYESATRRGAKILGEIVGYGSTCDAHHVTAPAPDGEGAVRAMEMAINQAEIAKEKIDYINAHGTGTGMNDKIETLAIKTVFGKDAPPVSSTKSMTGHLLGAAGAIEAVACLCALEDGFIPPTIGYKIPDEDCDLDVVPNVGRACELDYVLSDSFGFGGHNTAIVFKRHS